MAQLIYLGKEELKKHNLKFVVVNQPAFVSSTTTKVNRMITKIFNTQDDLLASLKAAGPVVVFDMPSVYKEKTNRTIEGTQDKYAVRYCPVSFNDIQFISTNLKETKDVIYSYKWDFSCWY